MSSRCLIAAVVLAALPTGCARDAVDGDCPAVAAGQLVVTEVRGNQSGNDSYGQWIEIFNASPAAIDLRGLELHVQRVDGDADGAILVRDSVVIDAGGYAVIGRFTADNRPEHVDYAYVLACETASSGCDEHWLDTSLYDAAAIDLNACGERIDRAIYRDLPTRGTWVLSSASPPDATGNDDESTWCVDDEEDDLTEQLGIRGTPGEANPSCN